jgi:hypothetical protein
MNTTITIELTPEERIELLRLRDRLLAESRDRRLIYLRDKDSGVETYRGPSFTDASRDAGLALPILERILEFGKGEVTSSKN